jgi:ParB family chromosome partitioning protein
MGHARALLPLERAEVVRRVAAQVERDGLSVRATEALVRLLINPQRGNPKETKEESANVKALAARLQRRLGARCRVMPRTAQSGKLEIEYTSLDELDGILERIGA